MEPVSTIEENSFDPTPRLKSSPIPIKFISFNNGDENCICCGEKYIQSLLSYKQKYCKKCLSSYINDTTDYNLYLDVLVDLECNCYLTSTERVESSLVKKQISICYVPWCCHDDPLLNNIILYDNLSKFENIVKNIDKYFMHMDILDALCRKNITIPIKWIPYSQFKDVKEMTKGGYEGLEHIHKNKFIHRDFHSGNMLFDLNTSAGKNYQWKIGDLGLSQEINNESSNDEIYGIIPYIAPEIFKGCWDPDPTKRPSIKDIRLTFGRWAFKGKNKAEFIQAETKRIELIQSKKLGPEFAEKRHSEAIYISRPLSALISNCSSTNSSSISFGNKKDSNYIYISEEQDLDIDIESSSSQNLSLKIPNTSTFFKKRNIEELNLETDDKSVGKRNKTS
ncbi:kinase-like domain-containing protein [Rhizophagus irregularis DAOM 181602=DAOM 197198]|nr:kinase-like domain-containing protein [Rhizophagus irregularis DAOM 181602=DAOM 197198]